MDTSAVKLAKESVVILFRDIHGKLFDMETDIRLLTNKKVSKDITYTMMRINIGKTFGRGLNPIEKYGDLKYFDFDGIMVKNEVAETYSDVKPRIFVECPIALTSIDILLRTVGDVTTCLTITNDFISYRPIWNMFLSLPEYDPSEESKEEETK